MAKLWRSKDWYEKYPDKCESCPKVTEDEWGKLCDLPCGEYTSRSNFEAGADAIIKELRNLGVRNEKGSYSKWEHDNLISWDCTQSGYTVFIPDEEDKSA